MRLFISFLMILILCASALAQSPGEIAGYTEYDYQTNGSSGQRITVDELGGTHVVWYGGTEPMYEPYYNYYIPDSGFTMVGGNHIWTDRAAPQIALDYSDFIGIVFTSLQSQQTYYSYFSHSQGIFNDFELDSTFARPTLSFDQNNYVHIVGYKYPPPPSSPFILEYQRSQDNGVTWYEKTDIDTLQTQSVIITSSRVSNKTAIIYAHPTGMESNWHNDVYYIQSQDGINWNWAHNKINFTHYGWGGDSLFAFTDIDAVYDFNDNLHIVWNAHWVSDEGVYYKTFLYHYDLNSMNIHQIAETDSGETYICMNGAWNRPICKMNIGVQEATNDLYVVYTKFSNDDCSAAGFANGELFMQYSFDSGVSWSTPENLTNSPTPGCAAGNCDSDHWSSIAEIVDENLHIFYVNDKDAGGMPQDEGTITFNPMLYLRYPAVRVSTVENDDNTPAGFSLYSNYPNPFNASTIIKYSLSEPSDVTIEIHDILGRKIETITEAEKQAGEHQLTWNAKNQSSGVYFYRIITNDYSETKKMVLLR